MNKKITFLFCFTVINFSLANPIENFAEISAKYIGTCYALNYLKKSYCISISEFNPTICENTVIQITPNKIKNEFVKILNEDRNILIKNSKIGVDRSFNKTLSLMNENKEKACIGYSMSMLTLNRQLYDELQRISKDLE